MGIESLQPCFMKQYVQRSSKKVSWLLRTSLTRRVANNMIPTARWLHPGTSIAKRGGHTMSDVLKLRTLRQTQNLMTNWEAGNGSLSPEPSVTNYKDTPSRWQSSLCSLLAAYCSEVSVRFGHGYLEATLKNT